MKTKTTQEEAGAIVEKLERYSKGLGHHSWWYTNRKSNECVNVKMHAWPDIDAIKKTLTKKEQNAVDVLSIDLSEYIEGENGLKWDIVTWEARDLADSPVDYLGTDTKHAKPTSVEYGGRSGGWAAIVFEYTGDIENIIGDSYRDTSEQPYTAKEIRLLQNAINDIATVEEALRKAHKDLYTTVEDPATYTEQVQEYVSNMIDREAEKIERAKDKLHKLATFSN